MKLSVQCAALAANCVALAAKCVAWGAKCAALAGKCVALGAKYAAMAGKCAALEAKCAALEAQHDALRGLFVRKMAHFHEKPVLFTRETPPDMPWDTGTWDSGTWDSDLNPKPKKKSMKQPNYFPFAIGSQIVWLQNFKTKLPGYAATLGLVAGDVTARLLDVDNAIYALDAYRGGVASFPSAAYERIKEVLHGSIAGNVAWLTFPAPGGTPAAVPYGCVDRVFTFIEDKVVKSTGYTKAIGLDLGIETAPVPAPPVGAEPHFTLRETAGGKLEVVWPKGPFDGVKLQFDLGGGVIQNDIDLRPNYTLNWLPPAGASAIIKVRLMYILKGNDTGNWSDWHQWTLTGV